MNEETNDGNLKLKRNGVNLAIGMNSYVQTHRGCFAINSIVGDVIMQPMIKSSFIRIHCLIHREQESGRCPSFCNLVMPVSSFMIVSSSLNCLESQSFLSFKVWSGASLVVQWLGVCLPVQGTRVRALVREDPACCGAAGPVSHNYWACALEPASHNYWACVLQLLKLVHLEPLLCNKRGHRNERPAHHDEGWPSLTATGESPRAAMKTQHSQKLKK